MSTESVKVKAKLATLSSSLDSLQATLAPLFAQSLPESIVALDPIQQAKLQTLLPYLVYDLIFIYLKSKGIDPKTHPVVPELDRVRHYFGKISNAENPETKKTTIDKAAAGRFIKHAITQAKSAAHPSHESINTSASTSTSTHVPVKVTSKMLERAQYEKEIKENDKGQSEDDELEVFVDDEETPQRDTMAVDDADVRTIPHSKEKAKAKHIDLAEPTQAGSKRRRPAVDPFAGYGDNVPEDTASTPSKKSKGVRQSYHADLISTSTKSSHKERIKASSKIQRKPDSPER